MVRHLEKRHHIKYAEYVEKMVEANKPKVNEAKLSGKIILHEVKKVKILQKIAVHPCVCYTLLNSFIIIDTADRWLRNFLGLPNSLNLIFGLVVWTPNLDDRC